MGQPLNLIPITALQVPILAELALAPAAPGFARNTLLAIYVPYLLLPAAIAVRVLAAGPQLFVPRVSSRGRYKNH